MLDSDGFSTAISGCWNSKVRGNAFFIFNEKQRQTKSALVTLNSSNGNLMSNVSCLQVQLAAIQLSLHDDPLNVLLLSQETICSQSLWKALALEESLLLQKSRAIWLTQGDKNTKFFANVIKSNWNHNKILSICNSSGVHIEDQLGIQQVAVDYFQDFLGTSPCTYPSHDELKNFVSKRISSAQAAALSGPILDAEILAVLQSTKKNKSPGPDGFNVNFFLHCWDTIGHDFTEAIHSFFNCGHLPSGVNSTAIALIQKIVNPSYMSNFRPISCCNTIYKCIVKILANRLKCVLPSLIDHAQSAFIAGRSISDNIFLAQELFRNYHRLSGPARYALKIDIRKAFDTVDWGFILDLLSLLQFPPIFINWIKGCITMPMFSVKVNGSLAGYFKGARGLRQGVPLSLYLFVLAMEAFSILRKLCCPISSFTGKLSLVTFRMCASLMMFSFFVIGT